MKNVDPKQLEMALLSDSTPSLAVVIEQIQAASDLTEDRRRDMVSGLRRVAEALGRKPADIPADPKWLQPRLARVMPAALGVKDKSWQNSVSNARAALAHVGIVTRRNRPAADLSPVWQKLWQEALATKDKSLRISLGRFLHYLSDLAIIPEDVGQLHADGFHDAVVAEEIAKSPDWVWQNAVWGWNRAVDRIPGWPQLHLSLPSRKKVVKLADEALPPAFVDDLAKMMQRFANPNPFEEGVPSRALRPATIKQQTGMLKRFASELLHDGEPEAELASVAALCDPARAERGLRAMVARNGGDTNTAIADMSTLLGSTARRLNLGDETLKLLTKLAQRLARPAQKGMTAKNRERLRPLQDKATLLRLLELPEQLIKKSANLKPSRAALAREDALAIAILLTCPLRIKNLGEIHLERDVHRPGNGQVFIVIHEEQVKNGRPIEFELPPDVRHMLDKHLATRAPWLCPPGTPWLFPSRDGLGPVNLPSFSTRLSKRMREEIGLVVNPHLFRHLVAMIWLTANPGAYEAARRLLGHASVSTTIDFYAGLETGAAIQAFGKLMAEKRKCK